MVFSAGGNLSRSIARNAEDGKVFTEAELQVLLRQLAQVCVCVCVCVYMLSLSM